MNERVRGISVGDDGMVDGGWIDAGSVEDVSKIGCDDEDGRESIRFGLEVEPDWGILNQKKKGGCTPNFA